MQSFLEFVFYFEGVNPQLAAAQLGKKWRLMDRVPDDEIAARLSNTSQTPQMNIDAVVKMLADADPTPNKEFFPWILTQYVNEKVRLPEDSPILHQDLTFYSTIKKNAVLKRLAPQIKQRLGMGTTDATKKQNPLDIMTLDRATLQKLVDTVQELTDGDTDSKRKKAQIIKQDGAKTIFKNEEWEVVEVEKGSAACYYAKGTRWCTSSEKTADYYIGQGPLYIVFQEGKPYCQIHFPSEQAMDPQDRPIKTIPDEIIEVFLGHTDLNEEEKAFLYKHADKNGEYYGEYIESLKKQFKEVEDGYKFRDEIYVDANFDDYSGDDSYVYMDAGVTFFFPRDLFITNPNELSQDHNLAHALMRESDISSHDYPDFHVRGNEVRITFRIDENESGRDDLERWKRFLKTVESGYNDDDDYKEKKHNVYNILVAHGAIRSMDEDLEADLDDDDHNEQFKWLRLDHDDYGRYGTIRYESNWKKLMDADGLNDVESIDTKPIVKQIETMLQEKSIRQFKHHQSQGVLPGFDKPRLPDGFVNFRRGPKVKVELRSELDKKSVIIKIGLEADLHNDHDKVLKLIKPKAKHLDEKFLQAMEIARKYLIKEHKKFIS